MKYTALARGVSSNLTHVNTFLLSFFSIRNSFVNERSFLWQFFGGGSKLFFFGKWLAINAYYGYDLGFARLTLIIGKR
jgi:hypothetical protein